MKKGIFMFVYDVETEKLADEVEGGWNNPYGMKFGSAVAYSFDEDLYYFFNRHERKELISLLGNSTVISFNGKVFDNKVLLNNKKPKWTDIDILEEIIKAKYNVNSIKDAQLLYGKSVVHNNTLSLSAIGRGTLNKKKNGSGKMAPLLLSQKKFSKLYEYNLQDVRLLKQIFRYYLQHGFVKDGSGDKIYLNITKLMEI